MDLLHAIRDLGVVEPAVGDVGDQRARAALVHEIERETAPDTSTGWAPVLRRGGSVWRGARGRRRVAALASAGVVVACSGIAVATMVDPASTVQLASPAQMFADNPADWNQDNLPNSNTSIVAASVKELGTINVPGVGTFQYWGAQTTNGEWCAAFRAPDGTWAGTHGELANDPVQPNYAFGGDVPGCGVWPTQGFINANSMTVASPGGFGFNFQGGGFYFSEDTISPLPDAQNTASSIVYGIIRNPRTATTVVDATSGAETPILGNGIFALVLPPNFARPVRLEAVDSAGNIVSRAYPYGDGLAPAQKAYHAERMRTAAAAERAVRARRAHVSASRSPVR